MKNVMPSVLSATPPEQLTMWQLCLHRVLWAVFVLAYRLRHRMGTYGMDGLVVALCVIATYGLFAWVGLWEKAQGSPVVGSLLFAWLLLAVVSFILAGVCILVCSFVLNEACVWPGYWLGVHGEPASLVYEEEFASHAACLVSRRLAWRLGSVARSHDASRRKPKV